MSTSCLIPNGKLIVVNFPAGAGGKMIQNCIGLSRHCVLAKKEWAQWQYHQITHYIETINNDFYQQKLNWVLSTLPPKDRMSDWLAFELREDFLYGITYMEYRNLTPVPDPLIYLLGSKNLWSTMSVHNHQSSEYYQSYWPRIKHVCLSNSNEFGRKSLAVKNTSMKFDEKWAVSGMTPAKKCFRFDIDSCIYITRLFVKQVKELYDYLEFDDFTPDLIHEYHSKYIALHL